MTITQTQRREEMMRAPDTIFDLYNSSVLGRTLHEFSKQQDLSEERWAAVVHCFGDTILGFYQTKDLPNLLQKEAGLSADAAQHIVAKLAEHLTPVLERERLLANPKLGEVKALHQQFSVSGGQPDKADATSPIATPPEETESVHNVTPMRTMAGDMNRIHGYGAYRQANPAAAAEEPVVRAKPQEEILRNRQPLTGVPKLGE